MAQHWIAPEFASINTFRFVETDVAAPLTGEVTIEVRAAGMNPADYKHVSRGTDIGMLPIAIGYEVAGVITAMGRNTEILTGGGAVGDEVLAFRVQGGYATSITVPADAVLAKPTTLGFAEAANLLLAATTASEMLHVTGVRSGQTIVVHGASGAVGVSVLQQAKLLGVRVIGTASEKNFAVVEQFGGEAVVYGPGLEQRVRDIAPGGVDAALDTVGTDEAVVVSVALVEDRDRIVTIAAMEAPAKYGIHIVAGAIPASAAYRDSVRTELVALAGRGELVVPIARTFALADAHDALALLQSGHPGGKLALIP